TLPGQHQSNGAGEQGRPVHALPARPSRRRGDRRGDRRSRLGGVRRGREPPACPESRAVLGLRGRRELGGTSVFVPIPGKSRPRVSGGLAFLWPRLLRRGPKQGLSALSPFRQNGEML